MIRSRRPPRQPRNGHSEDCEIPPDPKTASSTKSEQSVERSPRCMLCDIDPCKLSSLVQGHPAGRGTALLLQAVRQQVSVAASSDYTRKALEWITENDILTLKDRKQSVFSRVILSDAVDSREQLARLVNTIASYTRGREYLAAHLRTFLPTVVAVLRGRRLPQSTHDQLVATLQKMSVRSACQRELLQCGMLEWIVNLLENKPSSYATEYASAMAINIGLNPISFPLLLRFADSLAAAASNVLWKENHGSSCSLYNGLVLTWLGCSRVRFRARETKLLDAIKSRLTKKNCPLCALHIPYLIAIIAGDAEIVRVPQAPHDVDHDNAGNSCEREVDSTDPLRPSSNELSGARLLLRRALKENSDDPSVPGQVPRHCSPIRTTHGPKTSRGRAEPRLGTAASCHTFVIETERRRPLLLPVGLTDGAVEFKKAQDLLNKEREEEQKRLEKERERMEKEEREKEEKRLKSSRQMNVRRPPVTRTPIAPRRIIPKATSIDRLVISRTPDLGSLSSLGSTTPIIDSPQKIDESVEDYSAVFGSRPKVARTPEHSNRGFL